MNCVELCIICILTSGIKRRMLDKAVSEEDFAFRMLIVVACWIVGTVIMIGSIFTSIPLSWGILVTLAGLIMFIVNVLCD